jgi:FMN phosphatase YigB (HAD superfamily)
MKISSFDVFNTVLTRVIGSPKSIYLLLGKQLASQSLINCTPEAFAAARVSAESRAYRNIGEKYALAHIYRELAVALYFTDEQSEKILNLELELEAELIRPIQIARQSILAARNQGDRIFFLSDMYLPANFIQEQLIRHEFWQEGDQLYVSHEYGKSKATGELFRKLMVYENILPESISHLGNDLRVNVQGAKNTRISSQHFWQGNLNRYEQILESFSSVTEGLSSAMAGASRLVRLQVPAASSYEEALRDVAAGVVGPILVGYVLWILLQAKQKGLKRLYFVSRDGQILLEIARRLVGKLNINCELLYIYGSRLAWNLPALAILDEDQALQMLKRSSWILDTTSALTPRIFLARVNISPEEIDDCLSSIGLQKEGWDRIFSPSEQQVLHPLLEDPKVKDLIFQKSGQQFQALISYLNQEELLDRTPKGLVDLGWFGSSFDSLCPILEFKNATLDIGLFFGLRSHSKKNQCSLKKGYFFDENLQTGFKWSLPNLVVPLEMFCAADHGTVTSFIEVNGQAKPVFREERNQKVIDWGLPLIRDAVYCFTENLLLTSSLVNPYADVRETSAEVLKSFWLSPTKVEAEAWGNFPWEKGHGEKTDSLSESYRWTHVIFSFLTARLVLNQRTWVEGSIARSSLPVRIALRVLRSYRNVLSTIKFKFNQKISDLKIWGEHLTSPSVSTGSLIHYDYSIFSVDCKITDINDVVLLKEEFYG